MQQFYIYYLSDSSCQVFCFFLSLGFLFSICAQKLSSLPSHVLSRPLFVSQITRRPYGTNHSTCTQGPFCQGKLFGLAKDGWTEFLTLILRVSQGIMTKVECSANIFKTSQLLQDECLLGKTQNSEIRKQGNFPVIQVLRRILGLH